jgi:hypothetical protein
LAVPNIVNVGFSLSAAISARRSIRGFGLIPLKNSLLLAGLFELSR